jgi:site-specific DNA-methyltransferase (adenine-specific)
MTPFFEAGNIQIYHGDAREVLSEIDAEATACVTDPPYGLAFMGRSWDDFEPREYQDWCIEWGEIVMDALLPGAPVLAFSGTRTAHRLTCGLEDAGLVIRDRLAWMYGGGFPKSHDISKAIDGAKGAERTEVIESREESSGWKSQDKKNADHGYRDQRYYDDEPDTIEYKAPATDEAERWGGYGTALAPSHEPITLAMKPKDGTFAKNALRHGTAGLNIDGARVETDGERPERDPGTEGGFGDVGVSAGSEADGTTTEGRWPANVVLDEAAAELVDRQSGVRSSGKLEAHHDLDKSKANQTSKYSDVSESVYNNIEGKTYGDSGGASRFFYTAKASKSDRNAGLPPGEENDHPTVKPTDLIGWLLRLVEMPGQNLILDPFCGSGTTLYVAQQMGLPAIGIDQNEESCELAAKRLSEPSLFSQD